MDAPEMTEAPDETSAALQSQVSSTDPRLACDGVVYAGFVEHADDRIVRRVTPNAGVTLVIELGGHIDVGPRNATTSYRGFVAGIQDTSLRVEQSCRIECLEVQLTPAAAFSLLPADPLELRGAVVSLDDLWGRQGRQLLDRLDETPCWEDRFRLVHEAIVGCRTSAAPIDPEVAQAWSMIRACDGQVGVAALVAATGWSRKRLWAGFVAQVGLSPKRVAMLTRFEHASDMLVAGRAPAAVAAECGYADQSHLHRDVADFAGCTPGELATQPV